MRGIQKGKGGSVREKAETLFKHFHLRLWLRYALTYILVMMIPFIAFSVFVNQYLSRQTEADILAEMNGTLEKLESEFDQKLVQMVNISVQIARMQAFKGSALQSYNYETRINVIDTLNAFCATSVFYADIAYYHQNLPKVVFTTCGTYDAQYYWYFEDGTEKEYLPLDRMDLQKMGSRWFTVDQHTSPITRQMEVLIYSQPLSAIPGGYLFFEITEENIRKMLPPVTADSEIIIRLKDTALYPFHWQTDVEEDEADGELTQDGDGRYRLTATSEDTGISYTYLCETRDLGAAIQSVMNGFMLLCILLGLISLAAIMTASRYYAQPIERLMTMTKDVVPADVYGIARLQNAMNQLHTYSRQLADMRMSTLRSHALIRLIRGKYQSEAEAVENLRRLDMTFQQKWKLVMLLEREPALDETIPSRVLGYLAYNHNIYGFAYAEQSIFVMLVGMDEQDRASLAKELEALAQRPEFGTSRLSFALGSASQTLISAHQSYMEALSASRQATASCVALSTKSDENELFYPREELKALNIALQNQDRNRTAFLYDVLMKLVGENLHVYLYTVNLLSEMIRFYIDALPLESRQEAQPYGMVIRDQHVHDVDDMLACLRRLHAKALQMMTENDISSSTTEMTGIANYISACEELDTLTVNALADRYGMNISTLSHRFKEQMGCNISEYILTCKMNHACSLLRATDDTVAAIAEKVGYCQYTSFVRQFKCQLGTTPTAYRAAWRHGAPTDTGL